MRDVCNALLSVSAFLAAVDILARAIEWAEKDGMIRRRSVHVYFPLSGTGSYVRDAAQAALREFDSTRIVLLQNVSY